MLRIAAKASDGIYVLCCFMIFFQEEQRLFQLITVKVKGNDEEVLDSYTQFVTRAAKILDLSISGR